MEQGADAKLETKFCKRLREATETVERQCVANLARMEQGAEAKLKQMRAEVLREKLLRELDRRAATSAQEATAKLKQKAHGLSAYLRAVAAPCAVKAEVLRGVEDAMLGVVDMNGGASVDAGGDADRDGSTKNQGPTDNCEFVVLPESRSASPQKVGNTEKLAASSRSCSSSSESSSASSNSSRANAAGAKANPIGIVPGNAIEVSAGVGPPARSGGETAGSDGGSSTSSNSDDRPLVSLTQAAP